MDEKPKKKNEDEEQRDADEDSNNRVSTLPFLEEAKQLQREQVRINEETKKLNAQRVEILAEEKLSGRTTTNFNKQEKPLTEIEYSKLVERGERNPLKEDGLI